VKMSTRKANFITLDELMADVGVDVVRFFFLMRTISTHLNFDLKLAREASLDNPVYYVQYAHARICNIQRVAREEGRQIPEDPITIELLTAPEEMAIIKKVLAFPELVESCAWTCEPHRLAEYLHDVAGLFHGYYHEYRVVTEDIRLTSARLLLCRAAQIVFRNGFAILGISAPEKM